MKLPQNSQDLEVGRSFLDVVEMSMEYIVGQEGKKRFCESGQWMEAFLRTILFPALHQRIWKYSLLGVNKSKVSFISSLVISKR